MLGENSSAVSLGLVLFSASMAGSHFHRRREHVLLLLCDPGNQRACQGRATSSLGRGQSPVSTGFDCWAEGKEIPHPGCLCPRATPTRLRLGLGLELRRYVPGRWGWWARQLRGSQGERRLWLLDTSVWCSRSSAMYLRLKTDRITRRNKRMKK